MYIPPISPVDSRGLLINHHSLPVSGSARVVVSTVEEESRFAICEAGGEQVDEDVWSDRLISVSADRVPAHTNLQTQGCR